MTSNRAVAAGEAVLLAEQRPQCVGMTVTKSLNTVRRLALPVAQGLEEPQAVPVVVGVKKRRAIHGGQRQSAALAVVVTKMKSRTSALHHGEAGGRALAAEIRLGNGTIAGEAEAEKEPLNAESIVAVLIALPMMNMIAPMAAITTTITTTDTTAETSGVEAKTTVEEPPGTMVVAAAVGVGQVVAISGGMTLKATRTTTTAEVEVEAEQTTIDLAAAMNAAAVVITAETIETIRGKVAVLRAAASVASGRKQEAHRAISPKQAFPVDLAVS